MNAPGKRKRINQILNRKSPNLLPALIAVGGACGLVASPVSALELGEIQVNSTLGQPLRASIAYALNPNEQLHSYCIYLRAGATGSGMSTISDARIAVTGNSILLTGNTPIREPILNMRVAVDCAYTPHLLREYTLLVDPRAPVSATRSFVADNPSVEISPQAQPAKPAASEITSVGAPVMQPSTAGAVVDQTPIAMNTRYRVRQGDTISTIAARIENRSLGLWPTVDILFAANPDAFIDQDVNRIMTGSELIIPNLSKIETAAVDVEDAIVDFDASSESLANGAVSVNPEIINSITEDSRESPSAIETPLVVQVAEATDSNDAISELRPGDVVFSPIGSATTDLVSSDAAIDNQPIEVPVINSTTNSNSGTSDAWSWLLWLGGTGVALILGLLLFGRTLRERFSPIGAGTTAAPARRRDEESKPETRVLRDVDFEFEDTINAQAISLDADLEAGTGLNSGSSLDVAQDFGFSAGDQVESELDMEITEEATEEAEASPTDIIEPRHREEASLVLDNEEPPSAGDEEYDLSMIVDATKQPIGNYDATAKDLQAVQIDAVSSGDDSDYALSSAIDFSTLEQDYEEEFTATQTANADIEKAARNLAVRIDDAETGDAAAELTELDLTSELPAVPVNDPPAIDIPAISAADITAELTANLPTSIEAENDSVANDLSEITVEMTAAGSDITVDMQVHSDTDDSRKK